MTKLTEPIQSIRILLSSLDAIFKVGENFLGTDLKITEIRRIQEWNPGIYSGNRFLIYVEGSESPKFTVENTSNIIVEYPR